MYMRLYRLYDALKNDLPNVAPKKALNKIKENLFQELTTKEWLTCFYNDNFYQTIHITPSGAKKIIELYNSNYLPLIKNKRTLIPSENIIQFSKEHHRPTNQYLSKYTEEIIESDFSYSLLNRLVKFNSTEVIAGIEVKKTGSLLYSNSRKSSDWNIIISWIGSDGNFHCVTKDSIYQENRSNDPNRNWGLGRE